MPTTLRHSSTRREGGDQLTLASLKQEDIYLKGYADGHEAKAGIAAWVAFYNTRRPHQALGNRTPWRSGVPALLATSAEKAVDMTLRLDDAVASPTYPEPQQLHA